jgi:hypothetical protein
MWIFFVSWCSTGHHSTVADCEGLFVWRLRVFDVVLLWFVVTAFCLVLLI